MLPDIESTFIMVISPKKEGMEISAIFSVMQIGDKKKIMNILTIENITKSYGERKLFYQANFSLQEGEKAGIIGINGTGKSTLLKMIAGLEEPDEGKIIRANGMIIRYLPQNPIFHEQETVLEAVLRDNKKQHNIDYIESDAKAMLTRLGVTDFNQPCKELSGGQKKRLALVSVLLSEAELVVLDEPTNHLDNEMAGWLEEKLCRRKGAVIMVTHDRYFLDSVTNRIIEIDHGNIYSYTDNYSGYLQLKMQREEMEEASKRKRESILRKELAWVHRGARARSTKQKARLERFEEMRNMSGPQVDAQVALSSVASRLGKSTIELNQIGKSYGVKTLIQDFSYIFLNNDRVGFIGRNGSGKTTLLKIIIGELEPDQGSIQIGQTVKIGYYAQEVGNDKMDPKQRVIDYIQDTASFVETPDGKISASAMLERFLFAGEDQYGLVGKLSGGERRRLYLLKVLMDAPNVLILDEPTNDLDITTLQVLEDYLDSFPGIVIVVSHDRYFLDRTVRRIFAFEDHGTLTQYEGGYTDYYVRQVSDQEAKTELQSNKKNEKKASTEKTWKAGQSKKLKFTYQEQKDYETIEAEIARLEESLNVIEQQLPEFTRDYVKLNELMLQKEQIETDLEEKMERWMYLEDIAARIAAGELVN